MKVEALSPQLADEQVANGMIHLDELHGRGKWEGSIDLDDLNAASSETCVKAQLSGGRLKSGWEEELNGQNPVNLGFAIFSCNIDQVMRDGKVLTDAWRRAIRARLEEDVQNLDTSWVVACQQ